LTTTFRVDLRPSLTLAALIVTGHLAAVVGAWMVLAPAAAALATAGLGLSLVGFFRLRRRQPSALIVGPEAQLRIVDRDGVIRAAPVLAVHVPVWWLAILVVTGPSGARETLCLLADSVDAESLRRLRAWVLGPFQRHQDGQVRGKGAGASKDPGTA
jgi:hypothetical protein